MPCRDSRHGRGWFYANPCCVLCPLPPVFGDQAVDRCQFVFAQVAIIQVLFGEFRKHWGIHLVEALSIQSLRHPIKLLVLVLVPVYDKQMIDVGIHHAPIPA